jgi:hypothetical protein
MKLTFCLGLLAALLPFHPALGYFAGSDLLAKRSFEFRASSPDTVLEKTVSDLRAVFRLYKPAFDSSTKVVRPLKVGGSTSHPTINLVAKKCVLFLCKEVELDATISIREVSGSCRRNYVLNADLSRSSEMLSDNYESLSVNICYQASGQKAVSQVEAYAHRAPRYSDGAVTKEIVKMLTMQIEPMTEALRKSLQSNGAQRFLRR